MYSSFGECLERIPDDVGNVETSRGLTPLIFCVALQAVTPISFLSDFSGAVRFHKASMVVSLLMLLMFFTCPLFSLN